MKIKLPTRLHLFRLSSIIFLPEQAEPKPLLKQKLKIKTSTWTLQILAASKMHVQKLHKLQVPNICILQIIWHKISSILHYKIIKICQSELVGSVAHEAVVRSSGGRGFEHVIHVNKTEQGILLEKDQLHTFVNPIHLKRIQLSTKHTLNTQWDLCRYNVNIISHILYDVIICSAIQAPVKQQFVIQICEKSHYCQSNNIHYLFNLVNLPKFYIFAKLKN